MDEERSQALLPLTAANYHSLEADRQYMSSTQLQRWLECAAAEYARQNEGYVPSERAAFLGGRYCHVVKLEPALAADFLLNNPELATVKEPTHAELTMLAVNEGISLVGARSPKPKTEARLREHGVEIPKPVVSIRAEFQWMKPAIETFDWQQAFTEALAVGVHERILTFEVGGVWFKVRIDNVRLLHFDDLKFMRNFDDAYCPDLGVRAPWYMIHRYDRQMAIYQRAIHAKTGSWYAPNIFAVSKQKVPDVDWVIFDNQRMLDIAWDEVLAALPTVMAWKTGEQPPERCEVCEYCRATKKLTVPHSAHRGDII